MSIDSERYLSPWKKEYEILKSKPFTIKQLIQDNAFPSVVVMLNLKYGVYDTINTATFFLDNTSAGNELKRTWTHWLCENGYIKEIKKEDEIKVGDFVKIKDMYFHCRPPLSLSGLIRTEDYGIVKEKTEENTPYTCKVEFLAHPSLSFYYRCKDLEKQNSNLFERVLLFSMDEKGSIVPDHCVYRKRR